MRMRSELIRLQMLGMRKGRLRTNVGGHYVLC